MIADLKDLKDIYEQIRSAIDKMKEPVEDLQKANLFLKHLVQTPEDFLSIDSDYKRYFYEDFSPGMLKRLTKERSKDDRVSLSPFSFLL